MFQEDITLQYTNLKAIELRADLLFRFNKVYSSVIKFIDFDDREDYDSLAN